MEIKSRKAQVWVETVVYTLIGLSIMGLVLAFALPKINEMKDKAVIDQTIDALNELDAKILDASYTAGSTRIVDFKIGKGRAVIDAINDVITFTMPESHAAYSESGTTTKIGEISVKTEKNAKTSKVELWLNYTGRFNITYNGLNQEKTLQQAPSPYKILIENAGQISNTGTIIIDLRDIS